jgi:hypothetical protein
MSIWNAKSRFQKQKIMNAKTKNKKKFHLKCKKLHVQWEYHLEQFYIKHSQWSFLGNKICC